jgi:uracil-DNA glycosylase
MNDQAHELHPTENSQQTLAPGWMEVLGQEFDKPYMRILRDFLASELKAKKVIYPHGKDIFNAFKLTDFNQVKVVVIGQDPYHGPGQAHGLSFSVKPGVPPPPSLVNIFQELKSDLRIQATGSGHLEPWARQGVLLLNAVLTVEAGQAASHQGKGWELFTDKVVEVLNRERDHLVFFLWGAHAQKKGANLDASKHLIIKSPHPSPLSSYRGFFGSKPFSKTNTYLQSHGLKPIDWSI